MWNYTDVTDETVDPKTDFFANIYGHNYASMYKNLVSVGPKSLMRFKDFKDKIEEHYFTVNQFREYLEDYINEHKLTDYVTFNTAVTKIEVNLSAEESEKHWKVSIQSGIGGEISSRFYDFVIVGCGHDSVPAYPTQGISNLDTFKGKVMHAHNFRDTSSEEFSGKNILIIGSKISGADIIYKFLGSGDESKMADFKSITIAQGKFGFLHLTTNWRQYIDEGKLTVVNSSLTFKEDSVVFEDGTEQAIDTVLF